MKKILGLVAIFASAACSSTPKETSVSSDIPAKAEAKAEAVKGEVKKAVKAVKEEVKKVEEKATDAANEFGAVTGTEKSSVTCSNKADTRKITVLALNEGGCAVVYNKAGIDKTVVKANSNEYCESKASKIKSNLEAAGFDCGGGAATSTSTDTQNK